MFVYFWNGRHAVGAKHIFTLFTSGMSFSIKNSFSVPSRMMTQLYLKCGSLRKELLQVAGGTHNDTWTMAGYVKLCHLFG